MADTVTTNYGWVKPEVGASPTTWGAKLNSDLDLIDAKCFTTETNFNAQVSPAAFTLKSAPSVPTPATLTFYNGEATAGQQARWAWVERTDAENGGNVGSSLALQAYSDVGALLSTPLSFSRATGLATFGAPLMMSGNLTLNAAAGVNREVIAQTNGLNRWAISVANAIAETGGGNGSDWSLTSYNDAGTTVIANPLVIKRSTSVATFAQPIVTGSDARAKRNVEPVRDALAIVEKLQGVFYQGLDGARRHVGLVAQDVASVLPEVVFEADSSADPRLGIAYGQIVGVLVNAVRELRAEVAALKARAA